MQREKVPSATAKCEDCGKRVSCYFGSISCYFGSSSRYPQGTQTASGGFICGSCMMKRHERSD